MPLPKTEISGIPFRSDRTFDRVRFRHWLTNGSTASIFEGFDPANGDLRIVKRIEIKEEAFKQFYIRELEGLEKCQEVPNVVRFFGAYNNLGEHSAVGAVPQVLYVVQEKGMSFDNVRWQFHQSPADWWIRSCLFFDLVQGLAGIHSLGGMHRDITIHNLLILGHLPTPTGAAICDFGKWCGYSKSRHWRLAAPRYLPPEVVLNEENEYNQSIDVWMLALALILSWFNDTVGKYYPRTRANYNMIREKLEQDGRHEMVTLLLKMFQWNPKDRLSATEVLEDPFFDENRARNIDGTLKERNRKVPAAQQKQPSKS